MVHHADVAAAPCHCRHKLLSCRHLNRVHGIFFRLRLRLHHDWRQSLHYIGRWVHVQDELGEHVAGSGTKRIEGWGNTLLAPVQNALSGPVLV